MLRDSQAALNRFNGAVHYEWDATGAIQIQTDHDISKGAASATSTAGSVLGLLQSVVTANNATNDTAGQSHNNLGLDPSRLPRIGHTAGTSWMEITHPDGTVTKETINPATIGQRMVEIALANDALAPVWQIDTARAHAQAAQAHIVQTQAAATSTHNNPSVFGTAGKAKGGNVQSIELVDALYLIAISQIAGGATDEFHLKASANRSECCLFEWSARRRRMRNGHGFHAIRKEKCSLQKYKWHAHPNRASGRMSEYQTPTLNSR